MDSARRPLAWTLGLLGAALLVWLLAGPRAGPRPRKAPLPVAPMEPSVGVPEEAKLDELLDEVEGAEVDRYGQEEAESRRRTREALLEQRFAPRPPREPRE